jgi:hypothetical protein
MSRWIPQEYQDYVLDRIAESDEQCVCSAQPVTYWNACRGVLWTADTAFALGDVVYPPTPNGKVYECITAGTTGSSEPAWGTTQDDEFTDGTAEWRTHDNYALANASLSSGDFVKANATEGSDGADGRKLTVAQKIGVVTHTTGTVSHTAFILSTDHSIRAVTTASTTLSGDNDVESGRTTIFFEMKFVVPDPQATV